VQYLKGLQKSSSVCPLYATYYSSILELHFIEYFKKIANIPAELALSMSLQIVSKGDKQWELNRTFI